MGLDFKQLNQVIPLFRNADEMILCHNFLSDTSHFDPKHYLEHITFFNLENNGIDDFTPLNTAFKGLPKL